MERMIKDIGIICGKIPAGRKTGFRSFTHDFIAVMTIGEALFREAGNAAHIIKSKAAVYVPAGASHSYDPNPKLSWFNYWMIFNGNEVRNRFGDILPERGGIFPLSKTTQLETNWHRLNNLFLSGQTALFNHGLFLFHSILHHLHMERGNVNPAVQQTSFASILQEMSDQALKPGLDLKKLAARHGFGYDNFRKQFKLQTGMSPKQYFINIKLSQCKSLLINSSLSIKQIAEMGSFENQYYFSRLFKSKTGTSPRAFRQRHFQP